MEIWTYTLEWVKNFGAKIFTQLCEATLHTVVARY
jgi:hypothetical protein